MSVNTRFPDNSLRRINSLFARLVDQTRRLSPMAWVGIASLVAGAAIRFWYAAHDMGIFYPDEIYKTLEPAHWLVYGYGFMPWEFQTGYSNWFFPGVIAGALAILKAGNITEPTSYLFLLKSGLVGLNLCATIALYWFVIERKGKPDSGWFAIIVAALSIPLTYFSYRMFSEPVAAALIVPGWILATRASTKSKPDSWLMQTAGASLLAIAVIVRISIIIFPAILLVRTLVRREWKKFFVVLVTLIAWWLVCLGWLDRVTWGSWFHSAIENVTFNIIQGKSALYGVEPWFYYAKTYWTALGPASAALLAIFCFVGIKRAPWLTTAVVLYAAVHSYIPHKEFRFVIPIMFSFIAIAALGADTIAVWIKRPYRSIWWLSITAIIATSYLHLPGVTMTELGQHQIDVPSAQAINYNGDVNSLGLIAHSQSDLCGLRIDANQSPVWSLGGYAYLHRNVPVYWFVNAPSPAFRYYNYNIRPQQTPPSIGDTVVATSGTYELVRLFSGSCQPDVENPTHQWTVS